VKVNRGSSQGFSGGIDGNTLVYERVQGKSDDLWTVDLTTMAQTRLTATATSSTELQPTISGDWVLFGRGLAGRTQVLLYNRSSGELRRLAVYNSKHYYVYPGQVNGNFAVWGKYTRRLQEVYLYDIATGRSTRLARPAGTYQYSPAVTSTGTVYFVRSRFGCGAAVAIYKQPLGGTAQPIESLRSGVDVEYSTYAEAAGGQVRLLYSTASCRTRLGDVYQLTDSG
jgi:Tol biopolymer transport system component